MHEDSESFGSPGLSSCRSRLSAQSLAQAQDIPAHPRDLKYTTLTLHAAQA